MSAYYYCEEKKKKKKKDQSKHSVKPEQASDEGSALLTDRCLASQKNAKTLQCATLRAPTTALKSRDSV